MPVEAITGVDVPRARERATRPMLERVLALAPGLLGLAFAIVARLPAGSRLRRRALIEGFSRGFAALNRRDPWMIPVAYEPGCEIHPAGGFQTLGLADCYRWDETLAAAGLAEGAPTARAASRGSRA